MSRYDLNRHLISLGTPISELQASLKAHEATDDDENYENHLDTVVHLGFTYAGWVFFDVLGHLLLA